MKIKLYLLRAPACFGPFDLAHFKPLWSALSNSVLLLPEWTASKNWRPRSKQVRRRDDMLQGFRQCWELSEPAAGRRERHRLIEQRRRERTKELLATLQNLLVKGLWPLICFHLYSVGLKFALVPSLQPPPSISRHRHFLQYLLRLFYPRTILESPRVLKYLNRYDLVNRPPRKSANTIPKRPRSLLILPHTRRISIS